MMANSRVRTWTTVTILLLLCLGLVAPLAGAADWYKLSGTMDDAGDVVGFEISPDNKVVVYTADPEGDEVYNLHSVMLDGSSPPVRLSDLSGSPGQPEYVDVYRISPDSKYVVYIAAQDKDGTSELYSVPIGGPAGAVVKLNKDLVEDGDLWDFDISPDSKWVVYSADQEKKRANELYTVPIGGPASEGVKISDPLPDGSSLYSFLISPDSTRVVYRGDQETYEVRELFSVPITGTGAIKLNKDLGPDGDVEGFAIDPDGEFVIYDADQDTVNVEELYNVPLLGPPEDGEKISQAMVDGGYVWDWELSSDGERVVYSAYQDTFPILELYSVPAAGPPSAGAKLNKDLVSGGALFRYELSEDGKRVVYNADQEVDEKNELYSVPIEGPASAGKKLNGALAADGGVMRFDISMDSARVVFTAKQGGGEESTQVFSVPIAGQTGAVKISGAPIAGGEAWTFRISPDSKRVVYQGDLETLGTDELYNVPIDGPATAGAKISGPMATGSKGIWDFWHSPDSAHVVYIADQDLAGKDELYATGVGQATTYTVYLPMVQH